MKIKDKLGKVFIYGSLICSIMITGIYSNSDAADTMSFEIYPKSSTVKTKPAILIVEGKRYIENIWFDDVIANKVTVTEDERFVVQAVLLNTQGTQNDLLNIWLPDDRAEVNEVLADSDIFALNQSRYKSMKYSAFLGKIFYAEFVIFVVQHTFMDNTNLTKFYPIKYEQGKYYMTNKLSDDPVFSQIMQMAKESFPFKTRITN